MSNSVTPALTTEAQLRGAVIDRLIAASLRDTKPAREATLERWRALGGQGSANPFERTSGV